MMRIPFGNLPSMTALCLDYIANSNRVRNFYPRDYSLESIIAFSRERPRLDSAHRRRLCDALAEQQKGWGGTTASVERLSAGAVVAITGQQPGLFSGPIYTILKAITVIKLARALEENGVPAVPVFWIASEDHDHLEIESTTIVDRDSQLQRLEVDFSNGESSPVGWLHLRDEVSGTITKCLSSLPESEFQSSVKNLLEASYQPNLSPSDAFGRMMTKLFDGTGLILVDPLRPELKSLAEPALKNAVRQNDAIRAAVLARSRALSQAGYHEQVKVDANFTGLFRYSGKSRVSLRPEEVTTDSMLSPNALLRPAVQDSIFPTAAFVAGPAELAYMGQAAAVYETLRIPVPPVVPRISATVLEARVTRMLRKYDMAFADVLRGRDFLKRKAVESLQGVEVFDGVRDRMIAELESLRSAVRTVDPTLEGAIDTSRQKVLHQIEGLRTKFINAEARRNETLERHLDAIANSLFPEKRLQERVINVTSFLARYGSGFITKLQEELTLDLREHQVIEI
jgi:bacillithiol synthase